ncbi:MAG: hypothetical protein RR626_07320 [Anaerovoracaceae bacterium]
MTFSEIRNNDVLIESLKNIARTGNVHHGYIFEGPWNARKDALAKSFAKAILCEVSPGTGCGSCPLCMKIENENYIDLTVVCAVASKGSKVKSVKNEHVEQLQERLARKPFEGNRNIALIKDADTMTAKAFNRFLKTLEEPPTGTVIMMLSENIENLPQTITSRCVHYRVAPWEDMEFSKVNKTAEKLVDLLASGAPYYKIKKLIDGISKEKEEAYLLLDAMEDVYRNHMVKPDGQMRRETVYRGINAIEEAREQIKRTLTLG